MGDRLQSSHDADDALRLRVAETRLRLALQAASIGIWEFHVDTGRLVWDERVREVVEADLDVEPTWTDHFLPAIHPEDVASVQQAFAAAIESAAGELAVEFRVVGARSGTVTWASLVGRKDEGPAGVRLIGTARDVTAERMGAQLIRERSQALQQLVDETLAERRIWADLVEASADPVAAIDTNLTLTALNQAYIDACELLFGVRLRIGDNLATALGHMPGARDVTESLWKRALSGRSFELNASPDADASRFYDVKFAPLRDASGTIVGAYQTSREVTARVTAERALKASEEALQRAQKMEAIGNLTGGIAHDFNNLLQVVSGNLQLLAPQVAGNARAERLVSNAQQGAYRGAKLAGQLLAFGRRQPLEPKAVNVGRLVVGMDDLLRRALGEEIEVETSISGGLWNSFADPTQLETALLNLAINGRDAMSGHGKLTIEVANAVLDDAYSRNHVEVKPGQYVVLAVTDTGSGMDASTIERVFEPFFSTKAEGQGTGLGLSMVYGFVKQSEGHVKIYSEIGHGTTVRLYLPRAMASEAFQAPDEPVEIEQGDATILVVEDDEQVRETSVSLLADLGYRTLCAIDAASALTIVESGAAIDMIFTDVVMPGPVRSTELARRAKERLPMVAILYTSGYTQNAIVHGGRLDPDVDLISKPYTREELGLKVADALKRVRTNAVTKSR
jgi:signal transduction histidine kinase